MSLTNIFSRFFPKEIIDLIYEFNPDHRQNMTILIKEFNLALSNRWLPFTDEDFICHGFCCHEYYETYNFNSFLNYYNEDNFYKKKIYGTYMIFCSEYCFHESHQYIRRYNRKIRLLYNWEPIYKKRINAVMKIKGIIIDNI